MSTPSPPIWPPSAATGGLTAALAATETLDVAAISASDKLGASLAVTEAHDTAAISAFDKNTASLSTTEASDAASIAVSDSSGPTFSAVNIGGGGYVTGLSIAPDGTMVCRVDVNGAYLNSTASIGEWIPLITFGSMPSGSFGWSGGDSGGTLITSEPYGPWEIAIAPNNTNVAYMLWQNGMYVTTDLLSAPNHTWTKMSNFPTVTGAVGNVGTPRLYQQKMAVDPNNAAVVLIGTPNNGLYASYNGTSGASATFTSISGVPDGTSGSGITGIAFDPSSGTTTSGPASPAAQTNTAYAAAYGTGVYTTTNGGASWAAAGSGAPTAIWSGICANSNYYASDNSAVHLFHSGTWYSLGGSNPVVMSINPFDTTWIAGWGHGSGNFIQGTLSGTTASMLGPYYACGLNPSTPPSDVGWIANSNPEYEGVYLAGGGAQFDPITANRLWGSFGYGVCYWDIPSKTYSASSDVALTIVTSGIQNMVATRPVSQAGYDLLCAVEDQQLFQMASLTTPPTASGVVNLGSRSKNNSVWDLDYSQSTPGVVVALSSGYYISGSQPNYSGVSTDGGATWTPFTTLPFTTDGGCITCTDANHIVCVKAGTNTPLYTLNGGSTWSTCSGLPSAAYYGADGSPPSDNPHLFTNDAAGNMYCYAPGNGTYISAAGPNVGETWTKQSSTAVGGVYLGSLQAVPGNAGYLVACAGYPAGGSYPQSGTYLYTSTNGGGAWSDAPNVESPFWFGFGQVYPGYTYPTLWVWGFVNKGGAGLKWGIWRSRDLGASDWTYITDWANHLDFPTSLCGDMNDYTKCYQGYAGSSFGYISGIT